jgi:hypothetical protein
MTFYEAEKNDSSSLSRIFISLKTFSQIKPDVEPYSHSLSKQLYEVTQEYYASIIFLFTTPLTFHQRLVLMYLIAVFPKRCSGVDIARALDISIQSKSIYRDLKALQNQELILLDEVHPRLKMAFANEENLMIARIIELFQIHGKELKESFQTRDN